MLASAHSPRGMLPCRVFSSPAASGHCGFQSLTAPRTFLLNFAVSPLCVQRLGAGVGTRRRPRVEDMAGNLFLSSCAHACQQIARDFSKLNPISFGSVLHVQALRAEKHRSASWKAHSSQKFGQFTQGGNVA